MMKGQDTPFMHQLPRKGKPGACERQLVKMIDHKDHITFILNALNNAMSDDKLSPIACRTFHWICHHTDRQDRICWPSIHWLGKLTWTSKRHIIRALDELETAGYIHREKQPGKANTYTVLEQPKWSIKGFRAELAKATPVVTRAHTGGPVTPVSPSSDARGTTTSATRGTRTYCTELSVGTLMIIEADDRINQEAQQAKEGREESGSPKEGRQPMAEIVEPVMMQPEQAGQPEGHSALAEPSSLPSSSPGGEVGVPRPLQAVALPSRVRTGPMVAAKPQVFRREMTVEAGAVREAAARERQVEAFLKDWRSRHKSVPPDAKLQ